MNTYTADADQVMGNFACQAPLDSPSFTGNVGIGTSSPAGALDVTGSSYFRSAIYTVDGGTSRLGMDYEGGALVERDLSAANDQWWFALYPGSRVKMFGGADNSTAGVLELLHGSILVDGGSVGIDNNTPHAALNVGALGSSAGEPTNPGMIRIEGAGGSSPTAGAGLEFKSSVAGSGYGWMINDPDLGSSNTPLVFSYRVSSAAWTEGVRFANNGSVGIGRSSPSYTLDVNGSVAGTSAYVSTSDRRLKRDIRPVTAGALSIVQQLKPVTFWWKKPKDDGMRGLQTGFVAQDVKAVLPATVLTARDKDHTLALKYNEFIPILTKAIQEQQGEIAALTALTKNQSAMIATMNARLTAQEHQPKVRTAAR